MRTHIALLTLLSIAALTAGCDTGPWDAPPGSEIQDIDDLRVPWFGCLQDPTTGANQAENCQDSGPVQIPVTIQVLDGNSSLPLNNIRIAFTSGYNDILLLPQEVIEALAVPEGGSWDQVVSDGEIWAEFTGEWDGDYRPTYYETWTDNQGLARFWIWVEAMPKDATGTAKDSFVLADIGVHQAIIKLTSSQ